MQVEAVHCAQLAPYVVAHCSKQKKILLKGWWVDIGRQAQKKLKQAGGHWEVQIKAKGLAYRFTRLGGSKIEPIIT